ncbi:MAG: riboflavin biosynthesis protein RibF [Eubacteriales bacterium]|nr:riboflavin biosynthesis protein RibF [Eubacteriales bacterium]
MARQLTQIAYDQTFDRPITVCLGFFDSLHVGHVGLIRKAQLLAYKYDCQSAVFTFDNNPFRFLGKDSLQVLTYPERLYRLQNLGVDVVIKATFDQSFADMAPQDFLERLIEGKNIKAIVVGSDYTYGKGAQGNVDSLRNFCIIHDIELAVEDMRLLPGGNKVSSRYLRKLVERADLKEIATQLATPYFVLGKVVHGRADGAKIGFKTANIEYPTDKTRLPQGVYETLVSIDGISLKAVTNVGAHPTFGDDAYNVEAHIIGLSSDLYDKLIVVEFVSKIRDIRKFDDKEQLSEQIKKDIEYVLR